MWDFSSSKLEFCSWQKRAQTRFPNNRWASSHISPSAEPPLLNRHFFSCLDQHIIFKNPFWLFFARKGSPCSLLHSRKLFSTRSDWWVEETTIIPHFNDMSGVAVTPDKEAEMYESFCVFKTEPKNTCLRCRLGAISNNRAPRFPRWEPESLWILFSGLKRVPGDRGVMHKGQRWGEEDSPRGPSPPCRAWWQVSVGLLQVIPKSQDTAHAENRLLRILPYCHRSYFKETVLSWGEWRRKCDQAEEELRDFSVVLFPDASTFLKVMFHPMVLDASFSFFLWCGTYHHSIFSHFPLKTLILDLESKQTSLRCLSIGATENSSS